MAILQSRDWQPLTMASQHTASDQTITIGLLLAQDNRLPGIESYDIGLMYMHERANKMLTMLNQQ